MLALLAANVDGIEEDLVTDGERSRQEWEAYDAYLQENHLTQNDFLFERQTERQKAAGERHEYREQIALSEAADNPQENQDGQPSTTNQAGARNGGDAVKRQYSSTPRIGRITVYRDYHYEAQS